MILPKFPKNRMKLGTFWSVVGGPGGPSTLLGVVGLLLYHNVHLSKLFFAFTS